MKRRVLGVKTSRDLRGISFVFYFLLYLMNFSLKRSSNSRFSFRIVRKTKVEKLQPIGESEFYGIVSSEAEMREKGIFGGKSKRGANYEVNGQKRGRKLFWKRNKVALVVHVREEAWTNSSVNKTVRMDGAGSYSQLRASVVKRTKKWQNNDKAFSKTVEHKNWQGN